MKNQLKSNMTSNSASSSTSQQAVLSSPIPKLRFRWLTKSNVSSLDSLKPASWYNLSLDPTSRVLDVNLVGKLNRKQLLDLEPVLDHHAKQARYTRLSIKNLRKPNIALLAVLAALCCKLECNGHNIILCEVPATLYREAIEANLHQIATFE